jgi:hypothetical protein
VEILSLVVTHQYCGGVNWNYISVETRVIAGAPPENAGSDNSVCRRRTCDALRSRFRHTAFREEGPREWLNP